MSPITLSIHTPLAGPYSWWSGRAGIQLQDRAAAQWSLEDCGGKLTLLHQAGGRGSLSVDWMHGSIAHRAHPGRVLHEDLVKAIGVAKGYINVWDWSLGLGKDAWMLANAGCRVHAYERHPIIYWLVLDAWRRAEVHPKQDCVALHFGEPGLEGLSGPDVVYFDPMFPQQRKSAKVKGAMQMVQSLLGCDHDVHLWLERALISGARRVVVKRPARAPLIACSRAPSHQICGKSSRFDVYQVL